MSGESINYWTDYIAEFGKIIWRDVAFDHDRKQVIQINL